MNLFESVKQSITARQAAEYYGIKVNRNSMAVCPFHDDKNPSMKLDKRFHCFGCLADGDAIDFVAKLFNLKPKEAAEKIVRDFGICYDKNFKPISRPKAQGPTPEQLYKAEENRCFRVLTGYLKQLKAWKTEFAPKSDDENLDPRFLEAMQGESHIEYLLDVLINSSADKKKALVAGLKNDVIKLEQRCGNRSGNILIKSKKLPGINAEK